MYIVHATAGLAPILRSSAQGRLLAAIFESSEPRSISSLAETAGVEQSTASREVARAERSGLVEVKRRGNISLVEVNTNHPLLVPTRQIVMATYGVPYLVQRIFTGTDDVALVLLFGSWARRWFGEEGKFPNDIDILVLGEPNRGTVDEHAESLEDQLKQRVQIVVRDTSAWDRPDDPFLVSIRTRPHYVVIGDLPGDNK